MVLLLTTLAASCLGLHISLSLSLEGASFQHLTSAFSARMVARQCAIDPQALCHQACSDETKHRSPTATGQKLVREKQEQQMIPTVASVQVSLSYFNSSYLLTSHFQKQQVMHVN